MPLTIVYPTSAPSNVATDPYFEREIQMFRSFVARWERGEKVTPFFLFEGRGFTVFAVTLTSCVNTVMLRTGPVLRYPIDPNDYLHVSIYSAREAWTFDFSASLSLLLVLEQRR